MPKPMHQSLPQILPHLSPSPAKRPSSAPCPIPSAAGNRKSLRNHPLSRAFAVGISLFGLTACPLEEIFEQGGGGGSSLENKVVSGLKTALEVGIDTSASLASRVDGYWKHAILKIVLPDEAEQALEVAAELSSYVKPFSAELKAMQTLVNLTSGLAKNDFTNSLSSSSSLIEDLDALETVGDSLVKYMNRAAEYAAPRSVPIFKKAILNLGIDDGLSILNSNDSTAATGYLKGQTFSPLISAYTPIVDSTLTLVPLTEYWSDFRRLYNQALTQYDALYEFQESWNGNSIVANASLLQVDALKSRSYDPIETESLGEWTTDKALVGLFFLVGEEEREIRRDPFAYVAELAGTIGDILEEVFGEIMKMEE
jgi:hypothetical protein